MQTLSWPHQRHRLIMKIATLDPTLRQRTDAIFAAWKTQRDITIYTNEEAEITNKVKPAPPESTVPDYLR